MGIELTSDLTNIGTWWMDNSDRIYRFWVYKRMFTPFEMDKKFMDEDQYDDKICSYGRIAEAVELPDGDVLIGMKITDPDLEGTDKDRDWGIHYYRLSEIRLVYYEQDQPGYVEDYDEEEW